MAQNSVLKALRNIPRARAEDVAAFADKPVGNIVDALGRVGAMHYTIKPVTSRQEFCGSALPVDAGPRDNLAPWAALRLAEPGDVMAVATGGHLGASVCGDVMVGMAANAGVAAFVTDGVVRDQSGIEPVGIPVFAAGVSPNSPQKNGPGSVGLPVVLGGLRVAAGDILRGDADGVVVIPSSRIPDVLTALEAVREKEMAMEAAVAAGQKVPDWVLQQDLEQMFDFVDEG